MFTISIPEAYYNNPWLVPFEQRFALLTRKKHRVAYFYYRPDNSTFRYRVYNMTQTLNEYSSQVSAAWFYASDRAKLSRVIDASDTIVICRSPYSAFLGQLIARARKCGRPVIFDTDDLVFDTDHVELIMVTLDQDLESETSWDGFFGYVARIGATLRLCDRVITTNEFLADRIRRFVDKPVSIIPNFLNREQLEMSDQVLAHKRRSCFERDERTHIGYFSGSPTHNKDFSIIIPALAQMLDEDPSLVVRLVGHICVSGPLQSYQSRVEIHPFCDFVNLQRLVGSTEINVVPLQDNVFTNCKSELKYFEAAAVGTVTVASPTHAFRHAVKDGVNGYIANEYAWQDKLRAVVGSLKGKGDPYVTMAEAAREHAERSFSWTNQLSSIEEALYPANSCVPLAVRHNVAIMSTGGPQRIEVSRGDRRWVISPEQFESFPFHNGDQLAVVPQSLARELPVTWGDTHVPISPSRAIRVPSTYHFDEFKGFRIPHHLVTLTGAGPESLEPFGKAHIEKYKKHVGLFPDMTIIDLGCGIGRVAFQLIDYLSEGGRYIGIDVTRDSILWCQQNITPKYPQFVFYHADAVNELYNPFGTMTSKDYRLPVGDSTVDRIVLASVFTHLLEDEVVHYMQEFRRVLKPEGRIYASFFLYSAEALEAAKAHGNTSWKATFECQYEDGVYGNDPVYPRGAVAYSDEAMQRMMRKAGLRLVRPYLKGWWSGCHGDHAEDGQDAAILALIN